MARPNWKPAFLESLRTTGNVTAAARAVAIDRAKIYGVRKKSETFAKQWDEAIDIATEVLEEEARRRAETGVKEAVYHNGVVVGHNFKYSDTLLIFLLKAHKPEKYRDNFTLRHEGKIDLDDAPRAKLLAKLEAMTAAVEQGAEADPGGR